jgi:hypothetical protein
LRITKFASAKDLGAESITGKQHNHLHIYTFGAFQRNQLNFAASTHSNRLL